MEIRAMQTGDYASAHALWLSCRGMGLNDRDDSEAGFARYLRRNPNTCFAAQEDGVLVGTILAGHDGRRGFIHHTAVHPEKRGRGIGRALVERALAALEAEGIGKVALVVFSQNEAGNAFWEKMGFEAREDLTYRNRALVAMRRMDT